MQELTSGNIVWSSEASVFSNLRIDFIPHLLKDPFHLPV